MKLPTRRRDRGWEFVAVKLVLCVDGTHENLLTDMSPSEYATAFDGSHVRAVALHAISKLGIGNVKYRRGPAGAGTFIDERFADILDFVIGHAKSRSQDEFEFYISGYSRGGAMAVDLANGLCQSENGVLDAMLKKIVRVDLRGVESRFKEVRSLLAGRSKVKALMLFDAVDMSKDIDGNPLHANIERVAHVVRSRAWGSRNGWGNVGLTFHPTGNARDLVAIDGTHAALGGLPTKGDIPKPLARQLLAIPRMDWNDAEERFRGHTPVNSCAISEDSIIHGTHVNSNSGGASGWFNDAKAKLDKQVQELKSGGIDLARRQAPLRATLQRYADDPGTARGTTHALYDKWLGGFTDLTKYFRGFADGGPNEDAARLIRSYLGWDREASTRAMKEIRTLTGKVFFD